MFPISIHSLDLDPVFPHLTCHSWAERAQICWTNAARTAPTEFRTYFGSWDSGMRLDVAGLCYPCSPLLSLCLRLPSDYSIAEDRAGVMQSYPAQQPLWWQYDLNRAARAHSVLFLFLFSSTSASS
jgi:hypothetical protein